MSHPTSRQLVGHNTVDVWLTGADIRVNLENSISMDQVIARARRRQTRIPSLVLSSHGGVGTKSRSTTISFDAQGRAIPAESMPRRIFERLFEPPANGDRAARERALASGRRRVDFLLEDSRSLRNNLGRPDQQRLDEFLQSLSEVETRLRAPQDWLGKALPQVDRRGDQPRRLAERTDRLHPHHARPDRPGVRDRHDSRRRLSDLRRRRRRHLRSLPDDPRHRPPAGITASATTDGKLDWAEYDRYLAEQFAYFLDRLASIREGDVAAPRQHHGALRQRHQHHPQRPQLSDDSRGRRATWACATAASSSRRPNGRSAISMSRCSSATTSPSDSFAENAGEFSEILARV